MGELAASDTGLCLLWFHVSIGTGFLTTRLEDDSGWTSANASWAFSLLGLSMIFGGPLFTVMAQRLGVRFALTLAFGLWPVFALIVLTGLAVPVLAGLHRHRLFYSALCPA